MRQELDAAREFLQATIEEHESTNEELKSANEEVLSSNEDGTSSFDVRHTFLDGVVTSGAATLTSATGSFLAADVGAAGGGNRQGAGGFTRSKINDAIKLIIELVGEEPVVMAGVRKAARDLGISERTLERAKLEMGVESQMAAGGGFQYWKWHWPAQAQQAFMDRAAGNVELIARYLQGQQD